MSNWRDEEIRELLSVRADADIVRQVQGTARDSVVYDQITTRLLERGIIRAKSQVNNKLKALKRQYHQVLEHNRQGGNDGKSWCYFHLCDAIWGQNHSTNALTLVGSTCSRLETPAASRHPETSSFSSCHLAPLSDSDELTADPETGLKRNDSALCAESPIAYPGKTKRLRRAQPKTLTAEMRAMLKEMDKDFNERERLRLLEQRQYEERVRTEARREKAQEMKVLQDMTSLLRQLVQQMPVAQPHIPHPAQTSWDISSPLCTVSSKLFALSALHRKIINSTSAPAAIGPYSQAVVVDRTVYVSGQLGLDVASGQLVEGGVQAQAKKALSNMGEILKAAGCDYGNVLKTTVLLTDINDLKSVNEVYKTFFSSNFPARAAYQVAALPRGGLVEIEAVAVLGPLTDS